MSIMEQKMQEQIEGALHKQEQLASANVMCRASFRGEATKEQLHIILEYIDDMKQRGYVFEKQERTDLDNGNVKVDYVLALFKTNYNGKI